MRQRLSLVCSLLLLLVAGSALAGDRVPTENWLRYADATDAGFDPMALQAAREQWESLPSSAFLVVSDGAVVADWGQTQRRFMCHSVRKSFLSALFGIYWDRGDLELNKTVGEIGIDEDDGLLDREKQARILDLLKARSGVFHPAAYAGRTDSRPRGSEGPGRYFAYNNWDFNTLAAILEIETGDTVFEAFDEYFGQPLQMEDWRVSDGYFHYQRDLSRYPAYPFRMSARDAARFGLLFARRGRWGDDQILSRHWVNRSTALYSIDNEVFGYGFMWWVAREPRFEKFGFVAALGVGNQMIAVLPEIDLVIVNRADTYDGQGTPTGALLDLVEAVLEARVGDSVEDPELVPIVDQPRDSRLEPRASEVLAQFAGEYAYPPPALGLPARTEVSVRVEGDHLVTFSEVSGTFATYLGADGWLVEEDSFDRYLPLRDASGAVAGLADASVIADAALAAAAEGKMELARERMELIESEQGTGLEVSRILLALLEDPSAAEARARRLLEEASPREVEGRINGAGYQLIAAERVEDAVAVFELNTRLFPEGFNTWDSLAEAHMTLGHDDEAIRFYTRSLELNPENSNAATMIERIRKAESTED